MKKLSDKTHHHHHAEDKNKNTAPSPLSTNASNLSVPKPLIKLKRKSRAPNRTPTTLLTANASNFRALVQQFTGCPTIPMSLGLPIKGPITLNFQKGRRESQVYNYVQYDDTTENPRTPPPHYYYDHQEQQQQQPRKEPTLLEKHTCGGGFCDDTNNNNSNNNNISNYYYNNDHWSTSSSSGVSSSDCGGMEVSDDQVGFDDLMDDFDFSNFNDLIAMNNMLLSNDVGY